MKKATNSFCRTSALTVIGVAMAVLLGLAPTPVVVKDRFNNNSINTNLWLTRLFGNLAMNEINSRLEFSAAGNTGSQSLSFLEVKNWGARWSQDFEVDARFRLSMNNIHGNREAQIGFLLRLDGDLPDSFTGYIATVLRESTGSTLLVARIENDNEMEVDSTPISAVSGKLTVEYDRSDDRLEARIGNTSVELDGVWAHYGAAFGSRPMIITIGCGTADGNITFPGTRAYLDDFEFNGVKRNRS